LIYVAATTQVVSAAIVVERREDGHTLPVQRPVYFISEVLSETKIRYPQIQKLLYAVILTRRKLRHYFESHPVTVVSSFPLGEIIQCREASGRIAKWAVEIMGETISFAPQKAIKSQVLADFVAEWVDTQLPVAPIQPELLGTFGVRRSSKTGFNSISVVQCVNRYPRTKVGIAVDRNNTKLDTEPKVSSRKASA
jgi:hypothetical protein